MSTNLHCDEFELIQTPTCITFMCTTNDKGEGTLGKDWRGVYARYRQWVNYLIDNSVTGEIQNDLINHLYNIEKETKKHKKLHFGII